MGQKEWGKKEKKTIENKQIGELIFFLLLASNRMYCFFERKVNFTRLFVSQVSVNRNSENNNKLSCDSKSLSLLVLVD